MKVRAVAVASERSNAIGSLELECTPHGLVMAYLGVGSFAEGYATGARTQGTRVTVPWSAIDEARLEGERLFLAFDRALSPHNRMALVNFQLGDKTHLGEIPRRRLVLRLGIVAGLVIFAFAVALSVPIAPAGTANALLLLGVGFALALLVIGIASDQRIASGGGDSVAARESFVLELLGYFPLLARSGAAPPLAKPQRLPNLQGFVPRTLSAIVITLSACTLGAVLMARWVLSSERAAAEPLRIAPSERERALSREPAPVAALALPAPPAVTPPPPLERQAMTPSETGPAAPAASSATAAKILGNCECARGDSVLWQEPIPRLSILVLSSKTRPKGQHLQSEVEVAIVNNADKPLREITLQVNFFERDANPTARRHLVSNRPVYYEGPLNPGQAIKWSVEAEGSEFEIENPIAGDIGPGGDGAAPLSRFAELLDANHRPVRLHGAMMLAYLGDPRAREAALKLRDALREDESPYLDRVLQALADVHVCRLAVAEQGQVRQVQACVFNSTDAAKAGLALRLRALRDEVSHRRPVGRPPELVTEATWALPGELAAKSGARVEVLLDLAKTEPPAPKAFEALADREDLLP